MLAFLNSFAELLSLASLLPFLSALTNPQKLFEVPLVKVLAKEVGIQAATGLIPPLAGLFILAAILAGATRVTFLVASTRLSFGTGADISIDIFRKTLYQPYRVHISRNSSHVINSITVNSKLIIGNVLIPVVNAVGTLFVIVSIVFVLFSIDPLILGLSILIFGSVYSCIILVVKRRLHKEGEVLSREHSHVLKILTEGLGGIRDVIVEGSQEIVTSKFRASDYKLRAAGAYSAIVAASPRFLLETTGMLLLSALALYIYYQSGSLADSLPLIGSLALGATRLMPVAQQFYQSWTSLRASHAVLRDVLSLLDQEIPSQVGTDDGKQLPFEQSIVLKDISFRYQPGSPVVLRGINLEVNKGMRIGIVGQTGCGKSTLLDIIMALLEPTSGALLVDGSPINADTSRAWQRRIAHVPQSIFLLDTTVARNIAFGNEEDIDLERVKEAARRAQVDEFILKMEDGYETKVGERGIQLSGGQRQRIGIARALYKRADVVILDEATSALDESTEAAVMQSVGELDSELTVFIIAHRITTVRDCDKIIQMKDGAIEKIGTFEEVLGSLR